MHPEGLRQRARVLHAMRMWFNIHGYLEVPTPVRVPSAAMEENLYSVASEDAFLRTSPEFALKRVIVEGLPRIYEIGPCFRADEQGPWHGGEFLMCEWYRVGAELVDLMEEVRHLIAAAAHAVDRPAPTSWRRVTVRQLFVEVLGIDLARASAADLSPDDASWDDGFFRRWVTDIEPTLTDPVFVTDWPASQAALARVRAVGPWPVARRFEVFLGGVELANAFFELADGAEQRRRFAASTQVRASRGESPHPVDERFVQAVDRLPRTAGIAMGVDRLVAAVCGWSDIAPGRVS